MKRLTILLIIFIFTFTIFASPPHPELIKQYREEGRLHELEKKMNMMQKRMGRGLLKSSIPTSGTNRVLVILTGFVDTGDTSAAAPVITKGTAGTGIITGILSVIALLLVGMFFAHKKRVPVPAYTLLLLVLTPLLFLYTGCPEEVEKKEPEPKKLHFTTARSEYDEIFNGPLSSGLTMKQYFLDMSNNTLDLSFDIVGPFNVEHGYDYYGKNDADGLDMHPGEFVAEAVDLAEASGVDFSLYDNDGNGEADAVIVIHAGPGEASGAPETAFWAHQFTLSGAAQYNDGPGPRVYDGITINAYTLQPEYVFHTKKPAIGVCCHEMGHLLGLPDLYDTSYETFGVGDWSLMGFGSAGSAEDYNESDPAPLLAWERNYIGGDAWAEIRPLTASTSNITVDKVLTANYAYKVMLKSDDPTTTSFDETQYLIIEAVEGGEDTQWYVPGSGLLITHYHQGIISSYIDQNSINALADSVHGVMVVEANSNNTADMLWDGFGDYFGSAYDLFHYGNNASLSDVASLPNTRYYTGDTVSTKNGSSGVNISNISLNDTFPMTFSLMITP